MWDLSSVQCDAHPSPLASGEVGRLARMGEGGGPAGERDHLERRVVKTTPCAGPAEALADRLPKEKAPAKDWVPVPTAADEDKRTGGRVDGCAPTVLYLRERGPARIPTAKETLVLAAWCRAPRSDGEAVGRTRTADLRGALFGCGGGDGERGHRVLRGTAFALRHCQGRRLERSRQDRQHER